VIIIGIKFLGYKFLVRNFVGETGERDDLFQIGKATKSMSSRVWISESLHTLIAVDVLMWQYKTTDGEWK